MAVGYAQQPFCPFLRKEKFTCLCMQTERNKEMTKKLTMLMILDGYGYNAVTDGNAIFSAKTPNMDKYLKEYEKVCSDAGIKIKRFSDVDAFVADYLENQ